MDAGSGDDDKDNFKMREQVDTFVDAETVHLSILP